MKIPLGYHDIVNLRVSSLSPINSVSHTNSVTHNNIITDIHVNACKCTHTCMRTFTHNSSGHLEEHAELLGREE